MATARPVSEPHYDPKPSPVGACRIRTKLAVACAFHQARRSLAAVAQGTHIPGFP